MYQALEQFRILSFSNIFDIKNYMLPIAIILLFIILSNYIITLNNNLFLTKSYVQLLLEYLYIFVLNVIKQNIGIKGIVYFPIIFNTFYLIYFMNLSGLVGYNLQLTSHIIVTFSLSISLFIGIIIIGIINLKKNFINQFIPKDAPKELFHFLIGIEAMSYIIRPFTLGIRLFANMFSGHVLLFVIISFILATIEKKISNNKNNNNNFSNILIIFYNVIRIINNVFTSICFYHIIKCLFK